LSCISREGVPQCPASAAMEREAPAAGEELAAPLVLYARSRRARRSDRCAPGPREERRRKAPKTHLHAELVRKRRDPARSPKHGVQDALAALAESAASGDVAPVEALLARSGDVPVPEEWQRRYKAGAQAYWDHFYAERTVNFFKDRHYLREEFAELMPPEILEDPRRWVGPLAAKDEQEPPSTPEALCTAMAGKKVVLEVGCAVGNGILPLLRASPDLFGLACDLSPIAVQLLREKEEYRCGRCLAFPCDVTQGAATQPTPQHEALEERVPASSVDFVTLLFVLSAIDPALHRSVIARLRSRLRPGGLALFRDYGRGDLAQLRFAPGHWLGGDLYVRGDGTLAHFFTAEGLVADFEAEGFETLECDFRRTEVLNRATGLRMPRVWVQGKFRCRA